jgi:hypothetical protein
MKAFRLRVQRIRERISAFFTLLVLCSLVVVAFMASVGAARSDDGAHRTRPPATVTVRVGGESAPGGAEFDDGFRDAKVDDCEQGFKAACDWLRSAN